MTKENTKIIPIEQKGHICKLVVVSVIENFFAQLLGFNPIPLNKKNNPLQARIKNSVSLRQHAKQRYGSLQGELLEINHVEGIFKDLGYETDLIDFKNNFSLFKESIIAHIKGGNLIFAAFAVDLNTKKPTITPNLPDRNEHAAVIHGFDAEKNLIYMTHYNREWTCSFEDFYHSSMVLLDTRKEEWYQNLKVTRTEKRYKYRLIENPEEIGRLRTHPQPHIRSSLIPKEHSGFRGRLIVVKKPYSLEKMQTLRKELRCSERAFLYQKSFVAPQLHFNPNPSALLPSINYPDFIKIKHFAHVFLNGEINGTPLESFFFDILLNFLNDFIKWIKIKPHPQDKFKPIILKLANSPTQQQELFGNFLKISCFLWG